MPLLGLRGNYRASTPIFGKVREGTSGIEGKRSELLSEFSNSLCHSHEGKSIRMLKYSVLCTKIQADNLCRAMFGSNNLKQRLCWPCGPVALLPCGVWVAVPRAVASPQATRQSWGCHGCFFRPFLRRIIRKTKVPGFQSHNILLDSAPE